MNNYGITDHACRYRCLGITSDLYPAQNGHLHLNAWCLSVDRQEKTESGKIRDRQVGVGVEI
jgi:hypothetical protein